MKKIYKLILVLYLATGIAVSGYFYLYPNLYSTGKYIPSASRGEYLRYELQYKEGKEFGVSVLVTLVGCVLIGGIGNVTKKHK